MVDESMELRMRVAALGMVLGSLVDSTVSPIRRKSMMQHVECQLRREVDRLVTEHRNAQAASPLMSILHSRGTHGQLSREMDRDLAATTQWISGQMGIKENER